MSRFVLTAQLQLQAPNNVAQVVRQIQSQLNNVQVNVQVQGAQTAQRQIQQLARQTNQATTAAERMGRAFAVSVRRFAAFSIATRAVGLFTSTLSDAVKTAIDFEREMIRVSQVTGDSLAKLKSFSKVVTDLSTGFGVASSDILKSGQLILQAGFSAKDTEVALKSLAKAALAPNFDSLSETTEGAIAILAQFGEGVGALEKQLGSINAVAGAFAVEAGDLIDVIRRAGGVFKSSGGDLNELLALFTSVRATTRESAESIGTGLRTIFTRIQRPKTIEFLKQFGVELVDLNGKFVGPFEAVRRLSSALAGLGEGDITFIRIAEELGGFRQIGKVLPLLQQFSVAQQALNVANKAGNSLTQDAATAQQALAIKITKVREEFLALIRSVTETSTFQIMANTALTLASALIKVADSIKPLLPLLTAMAAIKIFRGLGSFAGSFAGGLSSGRTFNKGGKVHHFARGGMVPGSGNRDTVPAMLSPGEFVIRKSSVNKLGAGNLAAMNENRYEFGGPMTTAQKIAAARADRQATGTSNPAKSLVTGNITGNRPGNKEVKTESMQKNLKQFGQTPVFKPIAGKIGAFVLTPPKDNDDSYTPQDPTVFKLQPSSKIYQSILKKYGGTNAQVAGSNKKDGPAPMEAILDKATYPVFYPGLRDVEKSKQFSNIVSNATISGFGETIKSTINSIQSQNLLSADPAIIGNPNSINNALNNIANDNNLRAALEGYLFEGILGGITNAQLAGGRSNFDLPYGTLKDDSINLQSMFGQDPRISGLLKAEVKRSKSLLAGSDGLTKKIQNDINDNQLAGVRLVTKHFGGIIQKFNAGGVAKVKSIKFSNFRDIEKFLRSMWVDGIQKKRLSGERITSSDSWTFKHPSIGSVSLTGQETSELYSYFESQRKSLIRNKGFRIDPTEAILSYKDSSADLNMGLTDKKLSNEQKKEVSTLKKIATDKLPKTLYSGIGASRTSIIQSQVGKNLLQSVGKKFGLPGFLSTSSDSKVAKTFGNGLLLRIATNPSRKGIAADKHVSNEYQHEKEFILQPNSKFLINRFARNTLDVAQLNKGGGVGTDTVPALLTPGEFVVNRKAAQNIGYGSLNRMNKVGKYAKGGIVQQFSGGTSGSGVQAPAYSGSGPVMSGSGGNLIPFDTLSRQARNLANAQQALTKTTQTLNGATQQASQTTQQSVQSTQQVVQAQTQQKRSIGEAVAQNKMFVASMATSLIQGFLPAVDDNSGALLKVTHTLLGLTTTILATGTALEAFGVQLNIQNISSLFDLLSGKGGKIASSIGQFAGQKLGGTKLGGMMSQFGGTAGSLGQKAVATTVTQTVTAIGGIVGPLVGATAAFFAIQTAGNALVEAFMNYEGRLKKATESGNIEEARKIAEDQQTSKTGINALAGGGAGAIIGAIFGGPIVAQIGFVVGASIGEALSDTSKYAGQLAASQASLVKSQQSLAKASEDASKALTNFEKGNISSTDLLKSTSIASADAARARAESDKLSIQTNKEVGREGSFAGLRGGLRNVFTLGGLLGESTGERQNRLQEEDKKSRKEVDKREQEIIKVAQPALNALSKTVIASSGSFDDLMAKIKETDPNLYDILIRQGTKPLIDSFANLEKEAKRVRAALDAANLDLRGAEATSTAMSSSMDRFATGFETGGSMFVANAEFLSQAMTSAAQAMNPDDIKSAVTDVSANLRSMGVSKKYTDKFEGNTNAFIQAQQNYGKAFDNIIERAKDQGKVFSADDLKDEFAKEIGNLFGPDISKEAKNNITAIIGNIDLNPDEVNQILEGNYKIFGDKLTEAGQKQIADIIKISQERQKAEQVLIQLTQKRIESERKLVEAQQEALDLFLEGREVQAGAGGRAVSEAERRAVILGKANAQGNRLGLTSLRTGSVDELRRRNVQMIAGAAGFEGAARTEGGLQGAGGVTAAENQKDLQQAYKQQVETIRSLIKLEQEELKLIQEKNRLEKDSLESLITGDIEKFFEQQAAVGATAAIATGDQRLMNAFGPQALGAAFKDLQRQQEAGVQSSFGMQLGGPGGLVQMAAGAALGARGVQDQFAANTLAGTTPEEEARKARLRELGGVLGETGQVGIDMARMELNTAEIIVSQANIKLEEINRRGNAAAAQLAKGGVVYASNGIFVPRGTDTVPAMLTPGEFVVNRGAVNRGNNLQILQAMNNGANAAGMNKGGQVNYLRRGGRPRIFGRDVETVTSSGPAIDPKTVSDLSNALNNFNTQLRENITSLQNTKFQIKLDTTNVNVNLAGGSFLQGLTQKLKEDLLKDIGREISNYKVGPGGNLQKNSSVLG